MNEQVARAGRRRTAEVFRAVEEVLTPHVGRNMASTAAAAQCQRLGIRGEVLEDADLGRLLERLALGLKVFLGEARTAETVAAIRSAVGRLEEVP